MSFVIGLLMLVMVLVSIALIFLVLIQLPKKEAGIGVAFGGGATDALFGAGSGTVLTKVTKYAAIAFFALALLVGMLQSHTSAKKRAADFQKQVEEQAQQLPVTQEPQAPAAAPVTPAPATTPAPAPAEAPAQK